MTLTLATRDGYGEALVALGHDNPNVVVLDADLSGSTRTSYFAKVFPDRFFNMGVSEQDMIGTAAGFACEGKVPFASSFAMFATGRAWEPIRNSVCYPKLNVNIACSHAGLTVGEDGACHQATEDIAIMRALPNMRVLVPADYHEIKAMVAWAASHPGPCYIRFSREKTPVVYDTMPVYRPGEYTVLRSGSDVAIFACGMMVHTALVAADALQAEGITASVVNVSQIKPISADQLISIVQQTRGVVTAEEHSVVGGLGGAICELLSTRCPMRVHCVGVNDCFGESGKAHQLLAKHRLTHEGIMEGVHQVLH